MKSLKSVIEKRRCRSARKSPLNGNASLQADPLEVHLFASRATVVASNVLHGLSVGARVVAHHAVFDFSELG